MESNSPVSKQTGRKALILLGHGSRRNRSNQQFEELWRKAVELFPEWLVLYGYIEIAKPSLDQALEEACKEAADILILPLQLFNASHVKNDIPVAVAGAKRRFPDVKIASLDAISGHPYLQQALVKRINRLAPQGFDESSALLMIGRGSSDADANSQVYQLARRVGEAVGNPSLQMAFMGITSPSVEDALKNLARLRPKTLLVQPVMLFRGILYERLLSQIDEFRKVYRGIRVEVADVLGAENLLLDYMKIRVENFQEGDPPLPCLSCQYRVPAEKVESNVHGLKALLWSVRHSLTHHASMPHDHAHAPLRKHILVCTNTDCAGRGSIKILASLRKLLKQQGIHREVRVTRTLCMGRCGEGPAVVVYPDGVWYRDVTQEDCDQLVHGHIQQDQILADRVDHVMQ